MNFKKVMWIMASAYVAVILLVTGLMGSGFLSFIARSVATFWLSCLVYANW